MSVQPDDVLFAWDASHGIVPTVGGAPSFSRGGDKWVRTRARGGGPLYQKVVGDQLGFSWVERDGVLLPRRALDLERTRTPINDDSVDFGGDTAWTRSGILNEQAAPASIFSPLPPGAEARIAEQQVAGSGPMFWYQSAGTFSGSPETVSSIVEADSTLGNRAETLYLAIYDETAASFIARVRFRLSDGGVDAVIDDNGTVVAHVKKLAERGRGPNGVPVWRFGVTATGTSGNSRRFYPVRKQDEPSEGLRIYHMQYELEPAPTSPILFKGSPVTRPGDVFSVSALAEKGALVDYLRYVPRLVDNDSGRIMERTPDASTNAKRMALLQEIRGDGGHMVRFFSRDDDGDDGTDVTPNSGDISNGDLVEVAIAFNTSTGDTRLIVRINGGTPVEESASPSTWTPITEFGPTRYARRENNSRPNNLHLLRHLTTTEGAMDNDPDTAAASDVLDELADVPIGPNRAGVAT